MHIHKDRNSDISSDFFLEMQLSIGHILRHNHLSRSMKPLRFQEYF